MKMRTTFWLGLAWTAMACGDDSREGTGQSGVAFAGCDKDEDCDEGLFCAQGGIIAKHCAHECDADNECVTRLGEGHECVDAVCVQICNYNPDCKNPPDTFSKCANGLSCRGQDDDLFTMYCSNLCTVDSWGDGSREQR
jgi:hypothetical protein